MIKRRLLCHFLAALFSLFVVGPLVWLIVDREPPIKYYSGEVVPTEITPSQEYVIKWQVKVLRDDCEGTVFRAIIDSEGTHWATEAAPSFMVNYAPVGYVGFYFGRPRILQSAIPPGIARIRTRGEFQCKFLGVANPIHAIWPIKETYEEVKAMVVKP